MLVLLHSCLFLFIVASSSCTQQQQQLQVHEKSDMVTVTVYYEAYCPDSRDFITQQLYPTYKDLGGGNHVNLEFRPFGKATYKEENGELQFRCQHGARECKGNMEHVCLLAKVGKEEKEEVMVEFLNCYFSRGENSRDTQKCLLQQQRQDLWEEVSNCSQSAEGMNLLKAVGDETLGLEPKLYFVPWILINHKWVKTEFERALKDLTGVLCSGYLTGVAVCDSK